MGETTFTCPVCQKSLVADEQLVGQDLPCPVCGHLMTVPRVRAALSVKGRPAATGGAQPAVSSAPENLSELAEVDAFGEDREQIVRARRRWMFAVKLLTAIGMLGTLVVVVYAGYRFFDAREARKRQIEAAFMQQEEAQNLRRRQLLDARRMNAAAKQQGYWILTDDMCYRLWRTISLHSSTPQEAQAQFDAWVAYDTVTHGLFSECFATLKSSADIEPACQRLAGFALGRQGPPARMPPLAQFRELARLMLADSGY